jgi:hypothetical protein
MNIERNIRWAAALAIAAVIVAACGGEPTAAPTQAPAAGDQPAAATTTAGGQSATASEAEATQPPAAAVDEPATRDIGDVDSNLSALKSYRMRFAYTFEGKDADGKEQKGRIEFLQEYIADKNEQHVKMSGMGARESVEFFRVGNVTYIYSAESEGDQKCSSFSTSDSASMTELMRPGDILGGLNDAKLAEKGVMVNGVMADRYTFDETNVGFGGFAAASGEAWVSQDGEYLVKYIGKATGKSGLFGTDAEGTIGWEYDLEDINAVTEIPLPPECAAAAPADDIPVPPSATDKTQFGAMLAFKTKDALADVVAFYRAELPAQGWTEVEGEGAGAENMASLNFTKDDRQLTILITADEEGVNVIITDQKEGG